MADDMEAGSESVPLAGRGACRDTWRIAYVPTGGPVPVFRARASVPATYETLSEHYYGDPGHAARIACGRPPGSLVPANTWIAVSSALAGCTSRQMQIAVVHQASAFKEWMARARTPREPSTVAEWINPGPFAELLKSVAWPCRFSALHRVELLDAPTLAKDFESLHVCFLDVPVFRQLEHAMEQIVGASRGERGVKGFCLGDAIVVKGPRSCGRTGHFAELIAHEVIHRIQCCHVGGPKRWLQSYVAECHRYGLDRGICGYRRNRYELEAYGVAMRRDSAITATTGSKTVVDVRVFRVRVGARRVGRHTSAHARMRQTLRLPIIWLMAGAWLMATGNELVAGQFANSFLVSARAIEPKVAAAWVSLYWASLTVSRFVCRRSSSRGSAARSLHARQQCRHHGGRWASCR